MPGCEVGFYHLTRTPEIEALSLLLGRTLDAGKRALVWCLSEERALAIDAALWSVAEPVWLPHGTAKLGSPSWQPIWIEPAALSSAPIAPPNQASFLFLLDGVEPASLEAFERVFDLFDGSQEEAVAAARNRWSRLKSQGFALTYWRQEASGWKKAG